MSFVHEYPDPNHLPPDTWFGDEINDDVVLSHGDTLLKGRKNHGSSPNGAGFIFDSTHELRNRVFMLGTLVICCFAIFWHAFLRGRRGRKGYTELGPTSHLAV
jgi:hypothetical protein